MLRKTDAEFPSKPGTPLPLPERLAHLWREGREGSWAERQGLADFTLDKVALQYEEYSWRVAALEGEIT